MATPKITEKSDGTLGSPVALKAFEKALNDSMAAAIGSPEFQAAIKKMKDLCRDQYRDHRSA